MERLQKKCIAGSLMTHCALVGVLCLAAAFSKEPVFKPITLKDDDLSKVPFEFKFIKLTDGETKIGGGGGKPAPAPQKQQEEPKPAPSPPAPAPAPAPAVQETPPPAPAPKVEVSKPLNATVVNELKPADKTKKNTKKAPEKNKPKDEAKDVAKTDGKETKKPDSKVKVNLDAITRDNSADLKKQKQLAEAAQIRKEREAQAAAERAAADRARAVNAAFNNVGKGLDKLDSSLTGGGVDITLPPGPGYGQTYINYAAFVKEIYDRAWIVADSVTANSGIVRVEIVVQRNGSARGRILKSSGNAALDRSVQNALNSVSNIGHPFPEGSTDNTRTFIINFNLSSKRQAG